MPNFFRMAERFVLIVLMLRARMKDVSSVENQNMLNR